MKKTENDVWSAIAKLDEAITNMDMVIFGYADCEDSDTIYNKYPALAELEGKMWDAMVVIQRIRQEEKF